ncbi:MAG: hypothetical protein ACK4XK_13465 [Casimicrobiaceae bacterium]
MSAHHEESFIKTPKQLIVAGILAFAIPVAIALTAALIVTRSFFPAASPASEREAMVKPVWGFSMMNREAASLKQVPQK